MTTSIEVSKYAQTDVGPRADHETKLTKDTSEAQHEAQRPSKPECDEPWASDKEPSQVCKGSQSASRGANADAWSSDSGQPIKVPNSHGHVVTCRTLVRGLFLTCSLHHLENTRTGERALCTQQEVSSAQQEGQPKGRKTRHERQHPATASPKGREKAQQQGLSVETSHTEKSDTKHGTEKNRFSHQSQATQQ